MCEWGSMHQQYQEQQRINQRSWFARRKLYDQHTSYFCITFWFSVSFVLNHWILIADACVCVSYAVGRHVATPTWIIAATLVVFFFFLFVFTCILRLSCCCCWWRCLALMHGYLDVVLLADWCGVGVRRDILEYNWKNHNRSRHQKQT